MKQCIFLFLLLGCSYLPFDSPPQHIKYADKIAARFSRAYEAENQLVQVAYGGGMMDGIELVSCYFEGFQKVSIEEGRRLFVNGVESLCAMFNSDLVIRPYLNNYPFVQKNIRFRLSFIDRNFQPRLSPDVSFIFCEHNTIFYSYYDPEKKRYIDSYEEPYAEAVRIVHEERENATRKISVQTGTQN